MGGERLGPLFPDRRLPSYRLRLAVEEASMLAMGMVGYSAAGSKPPYPGVSRGVFWEKARVEPGSWYFDNDLVTVNWIGHPVAGTCYYLAARANQVSAPEALLWSFGTSALWEMIEYREPGSLNDVWVTPVAGAAIGEGFAQLSRSLDGPGAGGYSKALAWLFDPFRKLIQLSDGGRRGGGLQARPRRDVDAVASAGALTQGGPTYGAVQAAASARLFRVSEDGEAGSARFGFSDGSASALGVSATFAAGRTSDFRFDTETALVGFHSREPRREGDDDEGWDLFVDVTAGYEYGWHAWNLAAGGVSHLAAVRFPGLDVQARLSSGPLQVVSSLDVALAFAGVDPLGGAAPPPGLAYPTVQVASGYYYGLGVHVAPRLEVRWSGLGLGGEARFDSLLTSVDGPFQPRPTGPVASLEDSRALAAGWLRWTLPEPGLELGVRGEWRRGGSSVENVRVEQRVERAMFGSVAIAY